jgi:lipoate-protein ligase A
LAAPASSSQPLFDVERFRTERRRIAVVREVTHPTLVLGSTQPPELVAPDAMRARAVELVRRRGGGGAVYLEPADPLWVDAWIPRDDPLWVHDVSVAAEWVGTWWGEAFDALGVTGLSVHTGRSEPGRLGELVCFAGRGPGELFDADRKVVGLSQWRSREGALFSSCAYLDWDPEPLLALLSVDEVAREELSTELRGVSMGVRALAPSIGDLSAVRDLLVETFGGFEMTAAGGA